MKQNIAQEFDAFSDGYTGKMERFVPHYKKMLLGVTKYLPTGFAPKNILELGCGNGNVTALLIDRFPNAQIKLVDASSEMIQICRQRFASSSNLTFEENYFQHLDWPAQHYDLIVSVLSLHHLESQEKEDIFNKMKDSLSEKAIFACCDLFVEKDDEVYHTKVLKEWHQFMIDHNSTEEEWHWIMDHYEKYDRPNAFHRQKKWLLEAGFAQTKLSWNVGPWGCFHAYVSSP